MSLHFIRRLSYLESHHRMAIAAGFAALVFCGVAGRFSVPAEVVATWDAYGVCLLVLAWMRFATAKPRVVIRLTTLNPSSRILIFLFVVGASCASLLAVVYLLSSAKGMPKEPFALHIVAAIGTIIISWLVVHTIFALHYAYLFYHWCPETEHNHGGLQFPEGEGHEPDYYDFAYFSFVIGMTSQVSDVQIASQAIRRWSLLHGMISFAFNAAILALSINIISGMF